VGGEVNLAKTVQINDTLCQVSFKEEWSFSDGMLEFQKDCWDARLEEGSEA